MTPTLSHVFLSKIDYERFGYITAKAPQITDYTYPLVMDFCQKQNVEFLIARCLTTELPTVQRMERAGFSLMDTLVYYKRSFIKDAIPVDSNTVSVRPVRDGEAESVKAVAEKSFSGYFGHYEADENLDRNTCQKIYPDWAYRSCVSREVADEVMVAELDGSIVGFATLQMRSADVGEGVLFGIAPEAQRRGIYRSFMIRGMQWCQSRGANSMIVSTQIVNIAVQKVWTRLGFEPSHSYYTFHKWFNSGQY